MNISNTLRGNPGAPYRHNPNKVPALVRRHLAKARKSNSDAQNYGGSTGGLKNIKARGGGLDVLLRRAQEKRDEQSIFDTFGLEEDMRKTSSPASLGVENFDLY